MSKLMAEFLSRNAGQVTLHCPLPLPTSPFNVSFRKKAKFFGLSGTFCDHPLPILAFAWASQKLHWFWLAMFYLLSVSVQEHRVVLSYCPPSHHTSLGSYVTSAPACSDTRTPAVMAGGARSLLLLCVLCLLLSPSSQDKLSPSFDCHHYSGSAWNHM